MSRAYAGRSISSLHHGAGYGRVATCMRRRSWRRNNGSSSSTRRTSSHPDARSRIGVDVVPYRFITLGRKADRRRGGHRALQVPKTRPSECPQLIGNRDVDLATAGDQLGITNSTEQLKVLRRHLLSVRSGHLSARYERTFRPPPTSSSWPRTARSPPAARREARARAAGRSPERAEKRRGRRGLLDRLRSTLTVRQLIKGGVQRRQARFYQGAIYRASLLNRRRSQSDYAVALRRVKLIA